MALTKTDKEWLVLKMGEAVAPIRTLAERHEQALFGPNGDNGLSGTMKDVSERIGKLENFKNRVLGYASGASVAVTAIYHGLTSLWGKGH